MKRKWIIVEDGQPKWRAYVRSFLKIYEEKNPFFNDEVTFLVFREDDEREVNDLVRGLPLLSCKRIASHEDFVALVNSAKGWPEGIIVVLDFLLVAENGLIIQDKYNVASNWLPIESRSGDDIICLVTSEYNNKNYLGNFLKKGVLGPREVTGQEIIDRIDKATDNILRAYQEWIDRYEHPGKKLLHALMLARPIGNAPGHLDRRAEIYPGFPFGEALLDDDICPSAFKALFYQAPQSNFGNYDCGVQTLVRIMHECGVGCDIVATGEKRVNLPMSPGALFLFRLCYLVRMLRDEKYANPVVKIEFSSSSDKFITRLHFKQAVSELAKAFVGNTKGQTVPLLKTFESCCVPITPSCDQALKKTFEVAASSTPPPTLNHVESVRAMKPLLLNGKAIKVKFEERVILLEQLK